MIDAPVDSSGRGRGEERGPAALRAAGLLDRLGARGAGTADARVRDPRRDPKTGVIGVGDIRRASATISSAVQNVLTAGEKPLLLGGDCTILLARLIYVL